MRLKISGKTINEMGLLAAATMAALLFLGWQWSTVPGPIDGDGFTASSNEFAPVGGVHDTTSPSALGEGKIGFWRLSTNRHGLVLIGDGQYNERWARVDPSGNLQTIDANSVNTTNWLRLIEGYLAAGPTNQVKVLLTNELSATVSTAGVTNVTGVPFYAQVTNVVATTGGASGSTNMSGAVTNVVAVSNGGTFVVQENGAALTALQLIDNAISGAGFNITQFGGAAVPIGAGVEETAIRVTLPTDGTGVVRLGAGTAGIGKLTANSGVDIGDVDVLSIAAGDNNIGNVDIVSSALPTGAATSALQDATTNRLAGIQTTLDGATNRQATAQVSLTTLAGAVAGSEMQVDVLTLPATPAGNNNIGDVDVASIAAGDNNIGNMDIVSLPALAAGDNDIGNVDLEIAGTAIAVNAGAANAQTIRTMSASDDPIIALVDGIEGLVDGIETSLTTIIGHVDGIEGLIDGIEALLGTIDADTSNISSNTDTLVTATDGIEAQLTALTNYAAPYTTPMFWNSGSSIASNVFSSTACTVGPIAIFNTNNATVQFTLYNTNSGAVLGRTNEIIWSGPVPYTGTNSAGYAINLGGFRCTVGLMGTVTGGGTTNAAPAGPLWINGALKP